MNLLKTKTFELAVYEQGDSQSSKLALVLPGKLDTKDYPHMRSHVDFLARLGYHALSFDPPGTWESPGDISLYTMTNYLKAINEVIECFGSKPTFVIGHSRGGSMAMLAGILNPHVTHFGAIMSYYSFTPEDHGQYPDEKWKSEGFRISEREMPNNQDQKKQFKVPYSFLEDQIQYNALDGLRHSTKPKMFVLGKKDSLVSPDIVQKSFDEASGPKVLYSIDSDHNYRYLEKSIEEVNDYIGEFISNL